MPIFIAGSTRPRHGDVLFDVPPSDPRVEARVVPYTAPPLPPKRRRRASGGRARRAGRHRAGRSSSRRNGARSSPSSSPAARRFQQRLATARGSSCRPTRLCVAARSTRSRRRGAASQRSGRAGRARPARAWRREVSTPSASLEQRVGEEVGVSPWIEITQERIDTFAKAIGDFQWIHVDPARARSSRRSAAPSRTAS